MLQFFIGVFFGGCMATFIIAMLLKARLPEGPFSDDSDDSEESNDNHTTK